MVTNKTIRRQDDVTIDEISAQGELVIPSRVEVGGFCLAQYPDDRWYRATVTSIADSDATVYYVDYGNSCHVKVNDLREILPAVAEMDTRINRVPESSCPVRS